MTSFKPWYILHLDLSQGIPELSTIHDIQGVYVVFWWRDIPLSEIKILNTDLPLNASQVSQLAIKSITPTVANYLLGDGFKAPLQGIPADPSHAILPDLRVLLEIDHPLKRLEEKLSLEGSPDIPTSVVICTRDRPESLKRCLHSLSALPRQPLEILVVDNAPTSDETYRIVNTMTGVRHILEPRPGLDIARNTAVFYSSGDIIAFIDDDVTVHPHWLASLHRAFQSPEIMAVTGLVVAAELETEAQYIFETHWSFNRGYRAKTFDTKYFNATRRQGTPVWTIGAGANMAFRREVFALIGSFDERLDVGAAGCSGDSEFWYRVLAEGFTCRYEPASIVHHYHRRDMDSFKRQMFSYMRGHVCALLIQFERYKHFGNLRRLLLSLPRFYMRLIRRWIVRRTGTRLRTVIPEVAGCLSGVKFYLLNRSSGKESYKIDLVSNHNRVQPGKNDQQYEDREIPDSPLVSVVIPCYNQAEFLGEAIQSVLKQTYRTVEVIVIDDGSSDNTKEVATRFSEVRCVRQNNQGLAAARNTGIRASKGFYLVFLDADDRLLPKALESGLNCFRAHRECAFVFGAHTYIKSEKTSFENVDMPSSDENLYLARLRGDNDHYCALLYGNYIGMHASVMYRRDIFQYVKGFNVSLDAAEDYELYLRITRNYPIYFYEAVVAEYRYHGRNITKNLELMLRNVLSVLQSQRKYLKADKKYIKAYRAGRNFWIEYYGHDLFKQVRTQLSVRSEIMHAFRGIITLLKCAPWWFCLYTIKYGVLFIKRRLKDLFSGSLHAIFHRDAQSFSPVPSPGHVKFGDLRRLTPFAAESSRRQNNTIHRYYVERFFKKNSGRIHGVVLEAGKNHFTERYGKNSITRIDILHLKDANRNAGANIVTLADLNHVPPNTYDCIILPQILQYIYEIKPCLAKLNGILKQGGVLLATVPGISIREGHDNNQFWTFTTLSIHSMFEELFSDSHISVKSYGNVVTAIACMHGLTVKELICGELDFNDPHYQVVISVCAVKP